MQGEGYDVLPKVVGLGVSWRQSRECPDPICIPTTPGMNRNNPPLGQPMRSAQSLAEGEGWGAALGALRGALFRLCPHSPPLLPPPPLGWACEGEQPANQHCMAAERATKPRGYPKTELCCDPPISLPHTRGTVPAGSMGISEGHDAKQWCIHARSTAPR